MIKWFKKIFKKTETQKFDSFLKELVKERKEAINPRQRGTYNSGPRWYSIIYLSKKKKYLKTVYKEKIFIKNIDRLSKIRRLFKIPLPPIEYRKEYWF